MQMETEIKDVLVLAFSALALYTSARTSWAVNFQPRKLIATLPYVVTWQFSSWLGDRPSGKPCNRYITPNIWVGNDGAIPILVEDMRLKYKSGTELFYAYPMHKVGLSIIENPTNWKGQASLGHGGPLAGFVVRKGDDWRNEYVFSAPLKEFEKLIGKGILTIEVKIAGKRKWKHLVSEHFDFGEHPQH